MSYSSETKKELSQIPTSSKIEALLELSAMARMNASLVLNHEGVQLRLFSENREVILRVASLAHFLYGVKLTVYTQQNEQLQKTPIFFVLLAESEVNQLLAQSGMDLMGNVTEAEGRILGRLSTERNAKAYLRGAFLASGSVVDPEKSYHLEIFAGNDLDCNILKHVFQELQLPIKCMRRRDATVFYLKDSETISDFLISVGATGAMLKLENVKAKKELRNDINRAANAETANLDKQYAASVRQLEAIHKIDKQIGLNHIAETLRSVAEARLAHPSMNLRELGESMDPPVGKSGVNHRMQRIINMAEDLEDSNEKQFR